MSEIAKKDKKGIFVESDIVFIRRIYNFLQEQNLSDDTRDYFDSGIKVIGSQWRVTGSIHESGMTREEEQIVLPEIIGHYGGYTDPRDRGEFMQKRENFYINKVVTKVPGEGLRLEVGLEKPDEPLSENNLPKNVMDYVRWRHAAAHPLVGLDLAQAEASPGIIKFYIDDQKASVEAAKELNDWEDKALIIYSDAVRNFDKTEMLLTLMGQNIENFDESEYTLRLKKIATLDDNLSDAANLHRLKRFVAVAGDKDMQNNYEIIQMISADILQKHGMRIVIGETGAEIGATMKEAVLWMKDKKNAKQVNILKAQYSELAKSPSKLIAPDKATSDEVDSLPKRGPVKTAIVRDSSGSGDSIQLNQADNIERPDYS